jgi:hypothetical protein
MMRIRDLVTGDRISIGLLAAALFSCLVALTAAATPTPASIPERLLDRVRGANPAYFQTPNPTYGNCSYLEAALLSANGIPATAWTGCNLGNSGLVCVQCANQSNYVLKTPNPNGFPPVYPKPNYLAPCDTGNSQYGSCVVFPKVSCNFTDTYTCTVGANVYGYEP